MVHYQLQTFSSIESNHILTILYVFITLVLTTTLLTILLPGVTAPTSSCYVSFVSRSGAGRILFDTDLFHVSISLFSKLKWIPVFDLIKYRKLCLLFNLLLNPSAPKFLKNRFPTPLRFKWTPSQSTIHSSIFELFPYDLHIHFTRFSKCLLSLVIFRYCNV